nr:hypothetical protein [Tanacetum cinerariifolium]
MITNHSMALDTTCIKDSSEDFVAKQVRHKPHELVGSKSDSVVSKVCHQEVASEKHDFHGEGTGFIYTKSQDKYSIPQLLQLASNENSRPVVDLTQLEVDNRIDWNVGFDHMLDSICKDDLVDDKGEKGLVRLDDMMSMEENISYELGDDGSGGDGRNLAGKLAGGGRQPKKERREWGLVAESSAGGGGDVVVGCGDDVVVTWRSGGLVMKDGDNGSDDDGRNMAGKLAGGGRQPEKERRE